MVTDGTAGIGLVTVKGLLEEGVEVLLTGRNKQTLAATQRELGPRAHVVRPDTASLADIEALGELVEKKFGQVDFVFINWLERRGGKEDAMTAGNCDYKPESIDRRRLILNLLATPLFFVLFMFLPAGTWAWTKGWLFIVVFVVLAVLASLLMRKVNPDLLAARINAHQGTKPWDKVLLGIFLPTALAILPVAALDDGRFRWFPVPGWVGLLGYTLLLIGMVLLTWVEAVNKFFEPTVRIQTDRGQTVIDTGPYAIVRHPGYVSWLPISVGTALCLGSLWALIPAGVSMLVLILRTQWEDQTLQAELPGYKEYTERVRYRLLPWVW